MKKIIFLFLSVLGLNFTHAQNFEWAKNMGGTINEDSRSIAADAFGNVYTIGNFMQTGDFDPGEGVLNFTSAGSHDVFVSKLDASGNFVWSKQLGGTLDEIGMSIAVDALGNVYTVGNFNGTADFDPDAGDYSLTSAGGSDIFISKLDASGNFVWAKKLGGTDYDNAGAITVDPFSNVYITGDFRQTADFDPGTGVFNMTTTGYVGSFVSKLDALGNFVWAKKMAGTYAVSGRSIKVDDSGYLYTTGEFQGTADFDPGAGSFNLTSAGNIDVFVNKLDTSGNFVWAKKMGGTSPDAGFSIAVNTSGDVYATGYFQGTADLDPGVGVYNMTTAGVHDIFIAKLDASGNFLWARQFGGTGYDIGYSLDLDTMGNVYSTGSFQEIVDFNPGADVHILAAMGQFDLYILKLDASGSFKWVKQIGGGNICMGKSIAVEASGNVYTTGDFDEPIDFDPDSGVFNLSPAGGFLSDVFVLKLVCYSKATIFPKSCNSYTSPSGNYIWTESGTYMDTIPNMAGCDSIITINLTINHSNTGTDVITACDSYTWIDGNTYTSSNNTATHTLTNVAGCDSLVTLNLTINHSGTGTDIITACDSYTWIDGNTYTSSNNTATYTLTTIAGCDSLVTLNLTINYPNTGTDIITACGSYTWIDGITYTSSNNTATHTLTNAAGCDSVVTLNLTINYPNTSTDIITACGSYTWLDGIAYTSSNNTATHTLTNAAGCDSVVTLNLTINTVDVTVAEAGMTITANQLEAAYQWMDCSNSNAPITGETGRSYTAMGNGNYAVEITLNGCKDTSACISVSALNLSENSFIRELRVYPNPTQGTLFIEFEDAPKIINLLLMTNSGQVIENMPFGDTRLIEVEIKHPAGVYLLEVTDNKGRKAIIRIINE